MSANLDELFGKLKARITDPERQQLAMLIAADLVQLQAKQVLGIDVTAELKQVYAQAASLTASEAGVITDVVVTWIGQVTGVLARAAMVAAIA